MKRPLISIPPVPSFHIHIAICVGDDEDIDVKAKFRGWRGRILRRLGFTIENRWVLIHRPGELHIVPIGDGMDHDTHAGGCVCGPFAICEHHDWEDDSWLYTHASLDSREVPPTVEELTA